ncbi:MAG TPA: PhnD/SsuA/transferrin family substrate-binding protein [Candidatus Binatia bacterium]|nr:PhnD/SsuA/transferrin family substrate-binding protein [Candidatus Binatia bacterium]
MSALETLEIEFPVMRYDVTMPILEGRVTVDGVKLKPVKSSSMINKEEPKIKAGDFGLCDLNIGYWLPAIEAGWEIVGLPVFSKRKPVYQLIFIHADSGIQSPKDLEGKRVGSRTYRTALTVWARGLLQGRHGVDLSKIQWVVQAKEVFPIHDPTAKIEYVDNQKNMVQRIIAGELDAIITDISDTKLFETLENQPKVKRLFPDYLREDQKLYRETGIYTPVHMIVMSRKLDRERPDLAAKFYAAFEQAKQIAYDDILSDRGGFSVVYLRERMKEQIEAWGDPWKYGLKANQSTIDAFIQYNVEQGMVRSQFFYGDLFAAETLET